MAIKGFDSVGYSLDADSRLITLSKNTNILVGGVEANTEINRMDIGKLLEMMLVRNMSPITTIEFFDSLSVPISPTIVREKGVALNIKTIKSKAEKNPNGDNSIVVFEMKSDDVPSYNYFIPNDTEVITNPSLVTKTIIDVSISNNSTFVLTATSNKGDVGKTSVPFKFENKCYCGLVSNLKTIDNIDAMDITGTTSSLQVKSNINTSLNGSGKIVFAYDKSWGSCTGIWDIINNMNILTGFDSKDIEIVTPFGNVVYTVYLANIGNIYNNNPCVLKF